MWRSVFLSEAGGVKHGIFVRGVVGIGGIVRVSREGDDARYFRPHAMK
jgi:hypothetical protein